MFLTFLLAASLAVPQAKKPAPPKPPAFFTNPLHPADVRGKQAVIETSAGTIVLDLLGDAVAIAFLADRGSRARWVCSVCTGSLLLGAAGLLRGYRASVHWGARDALSQFGAEPSNERVCIDCASAGLHPERPRAIRCGRTRHG